MAEHRTFADRRPRPATWLERAEAEAAKRAGISDVLMDVDEAPPEFWRTVFLAAQYTLLSSDVWAKWERELCWATGLDPLDYPNEQFERVVTSGKIWAGGLEQAMSVSFRIAAIEHLLDVSLGDQNAFEDMVNDRARRFRVGLRLEGSRFVDVTSEHAHEEIVRPTLLLLSHERFKGVDDLYRKAFGRMFEGDPSGAITVASSAVEEMLRLGLDIQKGTLDSLAEKAVAAEWVTPSVKAFIVKLSAFRSESDAHTPGTDDAEAANFFLHLTASILLHLGRTGPFS